MTVLAIILYVLLGLLVLAFLLLCLKLSVRVVCKDETTVYAGISFFRIKLYPRKEKKKINKKTKKAKSGIQKTAAEKAENEQKKQPHAFVSENKDDGKENEGKEKKSVSQTVSFIFDIIKRIGSTFGSHGEIKVNELVVTVSKPDACDTAVAFGIMCSAVSTGLALCSLFGKSKINSDKVMTVPDFVSGKSNVRADIKIGIRGIFLVITAFKILIDKYMKNG